MDNELKYPIAKPDLSGNELKYVSKAVADGWVSSKGKFITDFESNFSQYVGRDFGVSTSNGTTALHLAIRALGIGKGDKVIVPDLTFAAPANAVLYEGAVPVFIDSSADYWNIDPDLIEEKIDNRTRAIIAVHLYGHSCDMDPIMKIAEKNNLMVIEDCAEAPGAKYKGRQVGTFGVVSCYSFYGNKIITTGEGGMCLSNDENLAMRMRILRDHGMSAEKRYWHDEVGYNYRMTNLQAALGVAQLQRMPEFIEKRRDIASWYGGFLSKKAGITNHPEMPWSTNAYWLYSILVKERGENERDDLMTKLKRDGVESRPFFYPLDTMPPYQNFVDSQTFTVSADLSSRGMNLPTYTGLNKEDIRYICNKILENTDN